jgi:hypothetical protein
MGSIEKKLAAFMELQGPCSFNEALVICRALFGEPRIHGSHHVFKTPWSGDPRINIQNKHGEIPYYQVKQIQQAIRKLQEAL